MVNNSNNNNNKIVTVVIIIIKEILQVVQRKNRILLIIESLALKIKIFRNWTRKQRYRKILLLIVIATILHQITKLKFHLVNIIKRIQQQQDHQQEMDKEHHQEQ